MRIAVIYNQPLAASPHGAADRAVLEQVRTVTAALAGAGQTSVCFAANEASALCDFLARQRPDLICNCCESFGGVAALEMNVAATFELFDVPFTGSSALTLGLALDKSLTKAVLRAHGIPTPEHVRLDPGADPRAAQRMRFPLIVKPAAEDASIGIDDGAVVHDAGALGARVRWVWQTLRQAALVEEFIAGREFSVSLLAASQTVFRALPIGEIVFDTLPADRPRIVGYEAKWIPESPADRGTQVRCPAALEAGPAAELRRIAIAAARAVGLRDYGRVDLRLRDHDQSLFVLEVNPNPDLGPQAGFLRAAAAAGRSAQETIMAIVTQALARSGARTPARGAAP